jgi:hypothetical protein
VIIGLTQKLYTTRLGELLKTLKSLRRVSPHLLDSGSSYRKGDLERSLRLAYRLQKHLIRRNVAPLSDSAKDCLIKLFVKIVVSLTDIEIGVSP